MKTSLAQPTNVLPNRFETIGEFGSGLEIIDQGLERQGIVPVDEITITKSGLAIYRIKTELTDGTLDEAIKNAAVDWVEATHLTLDALRVVSEMHAEHDIRAHGDINPQNIFVDKDHDTAAISGFYNTVIDEQSMALPALKAVLVGTNGDEPRLTLPAFTAPEVIKGSPPDDKSDVYEGARTLLYGLHGRALAPTVEYEEFINSLEPVAPPDLSSDFPSHTPNLTRFVIQGALEPNPQNRPHMSELVNIVGAQL